MKTTTQIIKRQYASSAATFDFASRVNLLTDSDNSPVNRFTFPGLAHGFPYRVGELQDDLTANLTRKFAGTLAPHFVRQVVNEASSLAATTPYPELFLPILAEEKVQKASAWAVRQRRIRQQTI